MPRVHRLRGPARAADTIAAVTSGRVREAVAAARRIVVKVGSSSLTTDGRIDEHRVDDLVAALASYRRTGRELVLVSSGAIASGIGPLALRRRPRDLATQQAAASVGQGVLLARYAAAFAGPGLTVGQVLLTADDLARRSHYRNAQRTLSRLLELGVVPIVNENDTVATDEIRFGDNDRLAALVAHLVHADALVLLSDVPGLYDGPPHREGTHLVPEVHGPADLAGIRLGGSGSGLGRGGMTTKVDAAGIATSAGIAVVLAAATDAGAALAGDPVGTLFHPTGGRTRTRLLWLRHVSDVRGRLLLDDGAVAAVVERRTSLLPAGITGVEGDFVSGDPVDLCDQTGHAVARGLVDYDATELPDLLGRSTRELARELGPAYEREVVHRDDLVVLRP
jgi:glutamate 5-kinase